jgi:hypothetical protein
VGTYGEDTVSIEIAHIKSIQYFSPDNRGFILDGERHGSRIPKGFIYDYN